MTPGSLRAGLGRHSGWASGLCPRFGPDGGKERPGSSKPQKCLHVHLRGSSPAVSQPEGRRGTMTGTLTPPDHVLMFRRDGRGPREDFPSGRAARCSRGPRAGGKRVIEIAHGSGPVAAAAPPPLRVPEVLLGPAVSRSIHLSESSGPRPRETRLPGRRPAASCPPRKKRPVKGAQNSPSFNCVVSSSRGDYAGFDETQPTAESGGKGKVIHLLKEKFHFKKVVMVGDGVTDMEACPPADAFVGFGGNVVRQQVKENAKWFITDFAELLRELEGGPRP